MGNSAYHEKGIAFAKNGQFESKIKMLKKYAKNDSITTLE